MLQNNMTNHISSTVSNDMSNLIDRIENRLGLIPLTPHLPPRLSKPAWEELIKNDTLVVFSRYYYNKIPFVVNSDTCNKRRGYDGTWVYFIKDEYLQGLKLLGIVDIDWNDFNNDNVSLSQTGGYGYYTPEYIGCPICQFETMMSFQMIADMQSLTNRGIFIDFEYPNKIKLTGAAGANVNLDKFVVNLLVQHMSLATISPTKMGVFEELAQADIANFLFKNLRYYDGLETVYLNIDLKLSELESEAGKRPEVIEKLENAYVSASNDNIPYMITI